MLVSYSDAGVGAHAKWHPPLGKFRTGRSLHKLPFGGATYKEAIKEGIAEARSTKTFAAKAPKNGGYKGQR